MKKKEHKVRTRTHVIRTLLLILLVYVAAVVCMFTAAIYNEISIAWADMESAVNTVAEHYRENSGTESRIEASYLKNFQSEVLVISHILSDYDIQEFDDAKRKETVDDMKEIRQRSSSRELYVCDETGRLFLASDASWLGASLVEKGYFTEEQLAQLTEEAGRPENLSDDADPQSVPVELKDSYGYCFCRQILDSTDAPTDYYLIMVYDTETINEGIDAWLDKTVLATAVSQRDPLMEFFILEEDEFIFSTLEGENWTQAFFTETESPENPEEAVWGKLKLADDDGNSVTYSQACQAVVQSERGRNYRILAAFDYNIISGNEYRFGGAAGSSTVLLALLLLFVIYCYYAYQTLKNKRQFVLISSGICVVALILFGIMASYFQSLEDLTEVTVTADQVSGQISELKQNQDKRSVSLAEDYMQADMIRLGLVAFDVQYSGQKITDADAEMIYHKADASGYTEARKDSGGNDLICYAGSELLKNKTGILSGADIWLINDTGFAIASSNPENWSLNINGKDYADDVRKVMYREKESYSVYYEEEDQEKGAEYVGSLIVYPVDLYTYTDADGHTAYTNRREYEKALAKDMSENAPKAEMGVLLVRTYQEPEALSMSRESYQNSLSTIVTAAECSYALLEYDNSEGKCLGVKEQIREEGTKLELEQLSVPEGIKDSTVFNYFQTISKQDCFVRVTKDVSAGEAGAIVFREAAVHSQKSFLLGWYLVAAGLAFLLTFLLLLIGAEKRFRRLAEQRETDPKDRTPVTAQSLRSRLQLFVQERKEENSQKKTTQIIKLLLYLVILLAALSVIGDLFLAKSSEGVGIFVNIYSTDWERCINAYNIGAVIAMLTVAAIFFGFAKLLISLFCVPLGRKVETYARLAVSVIQYALIFLGIFYGAYLLGMELKSIGTFATVIAGVIGIGSQQLISDVGSGVAMLGEGRYMIGDLVQVDGFTGVIREMGIRNCILVNEELVEKSVSNGRMNNAALIKKNVPIPAAKMNAAGGPETEGKTQGGGNEENQV